MTSFFDFLIHLDTHLLALIAFCGNWSYLALWVLIFAETGLVIAPFLPGDSLLFTLGGIAALPKSPLSLAVLLVLLMSAAVLGNQVNYWLGRHIGSRISAVKKPFFFNPASIKKTENYFKKYGGMTVVIARFLPILRTFAPFVAGVSRMDSVKFFIYNSCGGILWVGSLLCCGYFFGSLPVVKEHFTIVIYGIIALSLVPMLLAFWQTLTKKKNDML